MTVAVWGTTFISTKILLREFVPVEILFFRFIIAFLALSAVYPHRMKVTDRKHELYFAAAGLSGVTLYFLSENMALTYNLASHVGVIISVAPFFTAILAKLFLKGEKLKPQFFVGFVVAIAGISLISFNGSFEMKLNPVGDILTITAALVWAVYSVIIKKIGEFHYNTIQSTRRVFFYGLVTMIPALFFLGFNWSPSGFARLTHPQNLMNILYLGFGASALCFVTWNWAVRVIGAIKTSAYIYMSPVITLITSVLILHEPLTGITIAGTVLTMAGLFISESKLALRRNGRNPIEPLPAEESKAEQEGTCD